MTASFSHGYIYDRQAQALLELGRFFQKHGYEFTTITPASHARINARPQNRIGRTMTDIFGWSRPFHKEDVPSVCVDLLAEAGELIEENRLCRSAIRFSTLGDLLLMHSAFPTLEEDAVFFGPDTYRFAQAISASLESESPGTGLRIADIGSGSGAGGLHARSLANVPVDSEIILVDINQRALKFSAVNSVLNNAPNIRIVRSDILKDVEGQFDIVMANPPYMADAESRFYRDGGGAYGCDLSLRIVEEALSRLRPTGRLILYTGAPVMGGVDLFEMAVMPLLPEDAIFSYREIDPDVFGEELDQLAYAAMDRIAAVCLIVRGTNNQ